MVIVDSMRELQSYVGKELGVGAWSEVSQDTIDAFGALTGDEHWIHVDPGRAKSEGPFGSTIAHGFYTLALLTGKLRGCFEVRGVLRWANYGLDKVRFTSPVMPGNRLRLRLSLAACEPLPDNATRLRCACTLEIEGGSRPALVTDFLMIGYE